MVEKKKVLFVCYGGGHVNMVIPVYNLLVEDNNFDPVILGLTSAQLKLQDHNIPHLTYRDLLEPGDDSALAHGERLVATLPQGGMIPLEESIAYMGLNYQDLVDRLGEDRAAMEFSEKGRHAFLPLSIAERCVRKVSPDIIVSTNSPKTEKASLLVARKLGLPSVCIIDLFSEKEFEDRLARPDYADKLCVFGNFVKQRLIELGRKDEEIVVTGNPAFDNLAQLADEKSINDYKAKNNFVGKKSVLWVRTHAEEFKEISDQVEQKLIDLVQQNREWHLIVRPHPNEEWTHNSLPDNVSVSTRDEDLKLVLQTSDAVVSIYSTVILESALVKKPVYQIRVKGHIPPLDYTKIGVAHEVTSVDDLQRHLADAFDNPQSLAQLPPPGMAAKKVADVIRGLASN